MKRKLNIKKLGIFLLGIIIIIIVFIALISNLVKTSKYHKTYEYKLSEVGYTENETKIIISSLENTQIDEVLKMKYNNNITKLLKEKYFIYNNLNRYLDYYSNHEKIDATKVVAIVNTGADSDWYDNVKSTDTSKGTSMLINKFYALSEGYEPEDLVEVPGYYAYSDVSVSKVIYDNLTEMLDAARSAGYTLVVSQGFRSYKEQLDTYKDIENSSSTEYAEIIAARAGHSEYQSGLGILIAPYAKDPSENKTSPEHTWLINNAHKYGFILRYPEGTEDITGFNSDAWRLRFVGVDISSKIKNENITFDEYYAYYINK